MLIQALRASLVFFFVFTVLTGFAYPALVTGVAQTLFPSETEGSLLTDGKGKIIGSSLIGQTFTAPRYFWGRLSATSPAFNASSSSGSNLGVNAADLKTAVQARLDALRSADPENKKLVPVDLVTASGSGLDPHISPAAAAYQIARVAKARGVPEDLVRELVAVNTEGRQFGFFGEPRVNVLRLNVALDQRTAGP